MEQKERIEAIEKIVLTWLGRCGVANDMYTDEPLELATAIEAAISVDQEELFNFISPMFLEGLYFPAEGIHKNGFMSWELSISLTEAISTNKSIIQIKGAV